MSSRPLAGMRVVDASNYVTGPFAAMMLADLGADVVKVEPPGGDPNRRIGRRRGGVGMLFVNTNRNKRSVVLDLKDPAGIERFLRLLDGADVMVENWRPGVAERLGCGDDVLAQRAPRLVHLAITGFGVDGPLAGRGSFDSLAQGMAGLAWHNSHDGRPELLRTYVADKCTSTLATQSVLAALLERERTGRGQRVDVAMLDATAYFNFPEMFDARTVVDDRDLVDPEDNPGLRTLVATADGYIIVAPSTGTHVRSACEAVGHPEWIAELKGLGDFRELAPALMSRIESATSSGTTADWVERFAAYDVPAGPVLDLDQHLEHPQVVHNAMYAQLDHPTVGQVRYPRYPARFGSSVDTAPSLPAPELDQHAEEMPTS